MRVLIVVPRQDPTSGNWISAQRFRVGLEAHGHQVALVDTGLEPDAVFKQQLRAFSPEVTLLLHAYRTGKPWLSAGQDSAAPWGVLLTGTDVTQGLNDPVQGQLIRTVLKHAAFVLVQNPLIAADFALDHPELAVHLRLLTPGISLGTAPYDLRKAHRLPHGQTLFLCPAGLRPVKGVLELLHRCDPLAGADPTFLLAFCGPVLDEAYGRAFFADVAARPWARYLGSIPPQAMASAMRGADVIVNNSYAEGLSNALLEAATLGIPILARNIPGNAAVVRAQVNGLLYDSQEEFERHVRQLSDPKRRERLVCPDPERYDLRREAADLSTILHEALRQYGESFGCARTRKPI